MVFEVVSLVAGGTLIIRIHLSTERIGECALVVWLEVKSCRTLGAHWARMCNAVGILGLLSNKAATILSQLVALIAGGADTRAVVVRSAQVADL